MDSQQKVLNAFIGKVVRKDLAFNTTLPMKAFNTFCCESI